jgi:hypothetical protein
VIKSGSAAFSDEGSPFRQAMSMVTVTLYLTPFCREGLKWCCVRLSVFRRSSDEGLSKASIITPTMPGASRVCFMFLLDHADIVDAVRAVGHDVDGATFCGQARFPRRLSCAGFTTWMTGTSPVMTESSELCAARSPIAPRRPRRVSRAPCVESRQGPAPTPPRLDGRLLSEMLVEEGSHLTERNRSFRQAVVEQILRV